MIQSYLFTTIDMVSYNFYIFFMSRKIFFQ